jgi:hypothetical protein
MKNKKRQTKDNDFPIATIAFYGPDDKRASKVAVGIMRSADSGINPIRRWISGTTDVRTNEKIQREIIAFLTEHNVKRVGGVERIIGCPHEEGQDFPMGMKCPLCSFWSNRDRWTGEIEE